MVDSDGKDGDEHYHYRGVFVRDDTKWPKQMYKELLRIRMMLTLSPMKESLSTWVNLDARNGR